MVTERNAFQCFSFFYVICFLLVTIDVVFVLVAAAGVVFVAKSYRALRTITVVGMRGTNGEIDINCRGRMFHALWISLLFPRDSR